MDPFGHLPLEIRERIISNLVVECVLVALCQASPVFRHQLNTNKLLKTWNSLHEELDYTMFNRILVLVTYPKNKEPIPVFEATEYLPDPLFTPEQHLIFEMNDVYQRIVKCFSLGPQLVPLYRAKYPDFYGGLFSDYLAKSFGKHGEHLPTTMASIGSGVRRRTLLLLLAIETMDQCPSAFITSHKESEKQLSIREERLRRLAGRWIMSVPSAVWDDYEMFFDKKEE